MRSWLVAFACWVFAGSARAEPPHGPHDAERGKPWLVRLAPTAAELRDERERRLEQRLEKTLLSLPEVAAATVQLTLPLDSEAALDQPLAPPSAVVILRAGPRGPDDRELTRIVASALAHPRPQLTVVRRAPRATAQPTEMVEVGPFRVAENSAPSLRALLAVTLVTNALLSLLLLGRLRRPSTEGTES